MQWQEHSQCPPSSSAIRSYVLFQPQLSRTHFPSKSEKRCYIMAAGEMLMRVAVFSHPLLCGVTTKQSRYPMGELLLILEGTGGIGCGDFCATRPTGYQMNFHCEYGLGNEIQASGQPFARWVHVLFLATPTGEHSLMHLKPSDKHAASQERQKLILFCFHLFSQCTSVELTDIWISPRRIIPRTLLLNIAVVVGGCKCKGGIWKRLVNSCLGTT